MVCMADEPATECRVRDMTNGPSNWKSVSIVVRPSMTVNDLFTEVSKEFRYESDKFELVFQNRKDGDTTVILNDFKEKSISEIGLDFGADARNLLIIGELKSNSPRRKTAIANEGSDDDLILGASASPTATESCNNLPPPGMLCSGDYSYSGSSGAVIHHDTIGYVGLVNQAMTCYLNSLLQALYMTPEFRNALYNWEFDGKDEVKSIPYQLQKLFLNLQTSNKIAVETTELTKSFGWDSSEAWQQHDIQELCRVMFDALEQKFKNTKQADLINRLYEGKMIDYVKCLECSTEKSREDTFLDIPLPVRPFGSTVAYGSIEEALRAFVLPETLDGNNQYFCEKCDKKCDAHKGLKFSKFPYLLTLHLKRFDFDYSTLHRIKLNDKVVFPDILNLNSFIPSGNKEETENEDSVVKCDDSSTTDSGSALDEDSCQGMDTITANNHTQEIDYQDDDEGIDVSGGVASNNHENEKNRRHAAEPGPYLYELFSIMIHSGSASGGHYYAYIKDFSKGEWFCFNDQSVTSITSDDIRKTYGGGLSRGYYSGAFSSSTNAYMLMYRQRDAERNCEAMAVENFPPHIQDLLQKLKEREENERVSRENEMRMLKLHLYAYHPTNEQLLENTLYIFNYSTLEEATKEARKRLGLEELVSLENCRLVYFDRMQETIECSFEDRDQDEIGDVISSLRTNTLKNDFLLEIKNENDEFFAYKPGGLSLKVFFVDIESEVVDGPATIRGNSSQTVGEYKKDVAKTLDLDPSTIKLVVEKFPGGPMLLENDDRKLKQEGIYGACKIYVAKALDKDPDKPFIVSKLHEIIDQFEHVVSLQVILPDVDKDTLESLAIPQLDMNHNADKIEHAAGEPTVGTTDSPVFNRVSPLPAEVGSDQSNSEDSSLSDSDRTLVGDVPDEEGLAQLSISSMSPCVSSPEEGNKHEDNWDEFSIGQPVIFAKKKINYFKVTELTIENKQNRKTRILKALIDKRMNLATLKKELEPYVGVPMDYFKVYRQYMSSQEQECVKLSDDFKLFTDREKIGIKLGRALRNGEYAGKIFQLVLEDTSDPIKFLCDFFIAKGALVSDVKKGLLEELKRKCQLEIPYERCRLRKKSWKSPGKVCVDTERFETDINIGVNWELFVQELNEPETVTSSNQIVVFVRHWCPSSLELKPFKEVVLDKGTTEEFKQKISAMSAIPVENVETLRARGNFPSEMLVLSLHHDREWTSSCALTDKLYMDAFDDGHVYFFRDNREELKQLTSEELKELSNKETARMRRLGNTVSSTYSPRRERGLKIYLDSPKKEDDTEVD